jgi:hypothetical protein
MKALTIGLLALGVLAAAVTVGQAQAPAALAIPDPIIEPGPKDLYRVNQPPPSQPPPVPDGGQAPQWPQGYAVGDIWPWPHAAPEPPIIARPPLPMSGSLRFESIPLSAQVFVDGAYAGLVEDFGPDGHANSLAQGLHRIELRAEGFEPLAFDVNILPHRVVHYSGTMQRTATPEKIVRVSATPKTLYVIPKCYAGDKPPTGSLPPGCSVTNMRVHRP